MPMILQKCRIGLIVNISRVWGMLSLLLAKALTSEDGDICSGGDMQCYGDIEIPAWISVHLSSWVITHLNIMTLGVGFSYDEVYHLCQQVVDAKEKRSSLFHLRFWIF